jgi:hypothetical protein
MVHALAGMRKDHGINGDWVTMSRSFPAFLFFLALAVCATPASGQRRMDIGFEVAIPWYQGDLSTIVPRPTLIPPAVGPILRYNFNQRQSLRAHVMAYKLEGSGEIFNGPATDFQSSFVDLGLDFEFNWWPYKTAWKKTKYTPFVSAGLGYSVNYTGETVSHVYIPFGGGLKVNLGKRLSGGAEVSIHKTFTDRLDGVTNMGGESVESPTGNNDWYFFTGLFLSYKIFEYRDECPAYGTTHGKSRSSSDRSSVKNKGYIKK